MYGIKEMVDHPETILKYSTAFILFNILLSTQIVKVTDAIETRGKLVFSRTLDQSTYFHAYGLSFLDCIRKCDDRVKCKAVVYHRRKLRCGLYENGLIDSNADSSLTRREKEVVLFARDSWATFENESRTANYEVTTRDSTHADIAATADGTPATRLCSRWTGGGPPKPGSCGSNTCIGRESCDAALSQCAIAECSLAETATFRYIGNMQHIGAIIIRECNTGLIFPDGSSGQTLECASTGEWTNEEGVKECEPVTCTNSDKPSSQEAIERDSFDLNSENVIKIFCIYENDHGYTYISPSHLEYVTDLTRFYTRTDHVMLRHRRGVFGQWEGELSVLSLYSDSYNVTVLANDHTGFTYNNVLAARYGPYILVGLVPISFGPRYNTTQGYRFNRNESTFTNCDMNANNQFVLSVNPSDLLHSSFQCYTLLSSHVNCAWFLRSARASLNIPDDYFYFFTTLMGGCGGATTQVVFDLTFTILNINELAVGLRFDF